MSFFSNNYEGGHCDALCPFVRDCQTCAFRGGDSSAAQQDSAREVPASEGDMWNNGGSKTAPAGNRGLARSSGTSREGMAPMVATSDPARTPNGEVSCAREV